MTTQHVSVRTKVGSAKWPSTRLQMRAPVNEGKFNFVLVFWFSRSDLDVNLKPKLLSRNFSQKTRIVSYVLFLGEVTAREFCFEIN